VFKRGAGLVGLPVLVLALLLAGCGSEDNGGVLIVTTPAPQIVGTYRIPSESMAPTLKVGDRVEVFSGRPRIGEIVVFHPPEGAVEEKCGSAEQLAPGGRACSQSVQTASSEKFVKRIVAGPGDTIKIVEGHVILDGKREADSYIRACPGVSECNFPVSIKVPAGDWYLLGDNRGESDDSRFWGPVPSSWIIGLVQLPPISSGPPDVIESTSQ
jgi:signal peptidase I